MKNYKQILEAMLSESSGPKDNPYWGDATPVARVGIGKDGPKLMLTTRGEIKASRDEAAELEQIISNAKRPKPGELVPLNRFDADGKLLPPQQKPKKPIPDWMNQTPPTSPNSGQGIGRIRLPTPISTPPTPASPGQREAEIGTPPKKKPGKRLPIYGPPDSKNPFLPRPRLDAPEIRTGPAPRPVEVPVTPKPAPKPRLTPLSPEEQFKLDIQRGKYIQPPKESITMEYRHRSPPTESITMEYRHRSPPTESITMERWHRPPRGTV